MGRNRIIIENTMRVEAIDIFVIALNILVANGTGGIELLEAMSLQVCF
jgi:hypothetical protein